MYKNIKLSANNPKIVVLCKWKIIIHNFMSWMKHINKRIEFEHWLKIEYQGYEK